MPTVYRFEDLEIWQVARKIYQRVSLLSEILRRNHEYRFADQIKSSAGSAMDNIAEGFDRNSRLEFINSLSISKGECGELKSQHYRALDDKYLTEQEFNERYEEIDILMKRISQFILCLNKSTIKGLKFT